MVVEEGFADFVVFLAFFGPPSLVFLARSISMRIRLLSRVGSGG